MDLDAAKLLRDALATAIAHAEAAGDATVDLTHNLQQLDDAARAELQAVIDTKG